MWKGPKESEEEKVALETLLIWGRKDVGVDELKTSRKTPGLNRLVYAPSCKFCFLTYIVTQTICKYFRWR